MFCGCSLVCWSVVAVYGLLYYVDFGFVIDLFLVWLYGWFQCCCFGLFD